MNRKLIISLMLGAAISTGGLYLAFKNIPFVELWGYLVTINYFWLLPAAAMVMLSFILRVLRWQIILGSARKVAFWPAFHPLMIAFMINTILPGRVGELARPAILQKNQGIRYSTGLATVAAERALDIIVIITLFFVVMNMVRIDPSVSIAFGDYQLNRETLETIAGGLARLSLVLIVGMVMVSVNASRNWINKLIMKAPSLLFFLGKDLQNVIIEKISTRVVRLMDNFASGFAMIKSPGKMTLSLVLSILIWLLGVLSYAVFALGCPGIGIDLVEMAAVMVIVCIFIALPSVPGYWGLWEAGGIFALTLFGVSGREAAGFTLANHAIQMIPVMIIGAISAWITGVNIWRTSFT
ncbi:MAG: flippase-like domain-containing protein [Deltaproteobacteria bacterium]|nr:flippase-like domain-containing protein [Deltaproteobacteria bacterium]